MKLKTFSALIASTIISHSAFAETTVSGADYIQSSDIIGKEIQNVLSSTGECDIDSRDFTTGNEVRTYKNSTDNAACSTYNMNNEVTESTFTQKGYTLGADTYEFDLGPLVIAESMTVGESWGGVSNVTLNGAYEGTREDTITLVAVDDVSVAAGEFTECIQIHWVIDYSYRSDLNVNLWMCPELGVTKYEYIGWENSWELQDYTFADEEAITVSGADYIQSNDISYKRFELLNANIDDCNVEERAFNGAEEIRFISNSNKNIECEEVVYRKKITESTLDYLGKAIVFQNIYAEGSDEIIGKFSNNSSFDPSLPIILSEMTVGESWSQTYVSKGSYENDYFDDETNEDTAGEFEIELNDTFTLESIEDITVPAGQFKQCLNIYWTSLYVEADLIIYTNRLWICPEVGLVKYDSAFLFEDTKTWELSSHTENEVVDSVTVSGADYIQSNSITKKFFQDLISEFKECDIEERTFYQSSEDRLYSNSSDAEKCNEVTYNKSITESSVTYISHEYTDDGKKHIMEYSPGIPVIKETMEVGETWSQDSQYYFDGTGTSYYRTDTLTLEEIVDITINNEAYAECLKIFWVASSFGTTYEYDLWICPEIGLVKYNMSNVGEDPFQTWELQGYSTSSIDTSDQNDGTGNGSGGGGSLPLSLLAVLGLIAIRRKN